MRIRRVDILAAESASPAARRAIIAGGWRFALVLVGVGASPVLGCGGGAPDDTMRTVSGLVTVSDSGTGGSSGATGEGGSAPTETSNNPSTTSSVSEGSSDSGGARFDLGGGMGSDTDPPQDCDPQLVTTIRDFSSSHPDFEGLIATDPGIVAEMLGADGKPVYAGGTTGTTSGQPNFDQWYRDVAGTNQTVPSTLALTEMGVGNFVFDSAAFFPIDGQALGNEGNAHNYHFTLEMHTKFTYQGGEVFTFRGDDDLFTFVNGHLAIDLGGVHGPIQGTVDFDAMAAQLQITPGNTYDIDFFFAERHTSESNFRIETTIGCFYPPA